MPQYYFPTKIIIMINICKSNIQYRIPVVYNYDVYNLKKFPTMMTGASLFIWC